MRGDILHIGSNAWGLEVYQVVLIDEENWGFDKCSGVPCPAEKLHLQG